MNHTKIMRLLENAAVFLLIAVALFVLGVSFLHLPDLEDFVYHYLEINRTVQRMIALILLIGSWNLYKRKRAAWLMTLVLLAVNLGFHIVSRHHFVINVLSLCESAIIIVLLLGHKDFNRPWNNVSVKKAVVLASTFLVLMLANVSFGFFNLRHLTDHPVSFFSYVENTFRILFGFEPSINFLPVSGVLYERFIFWFSWICIVGCVVLVLKPLVYNKRVTKKDKEQVLELVRKYGQNPESYLCLEDDKTYFFGQSVEGVVAYGIVKYVVVVLGDPICAPEDFPVMLAEFKAFCVERAFSVIFLSTTDRYLQFYKMLGFGHVKCGEEARFNLETYNLQGGKAAKVRANINHAN
ncbi:MAG: phosphatidylglycerol lysyltransferase domain-containing protein, partial [Eubacterium sp.]